jgi:5-methylthioadenosine/S-adenosylhomocysteine deaminase
MSVLDDAVIAIRNGWIIAIEPAVRKEDFKFSKRLDGHGKVAIPGLIDAHTHTAQQLLRGGVVDEPPIVWIRILIPFEHRVKPDDMYYGALLACTQMIKAGITCFADSGSIYMEPVVRAVEETGIRASIARMTRDSGDFIPAEMKGNAKTVVGKTEELYKAYHGTANGRVQIAFSATSPMTTSLELAELVAAKAREYNAVIHIHLSEHLKEVEHCLVNYKLRPVEYLDAHGVLGPNLLAAHVVQVTDREVRLLAERDVKVVHCPTSNLTSHGFPKTPLMLACGISIGLGNDGASGRDLDIFSAARVLKYAIQARYGLPIFDPLALPYKELFRMATVGGAKALMREDELGTLEVGKKADIVLLDWDQPHLHPTRDVLRTLVMVACARDVSDVLVDGRILLRDREFVTLDEEEIMAKAEEHLQRLL